MKKIFALAIALVSMAAVMTSCNNDDNDYIMQPAPAPVTVAQQEHVKNIEATVDFMLPVTDVQLEMMDIELRYTISGKTYTVTTDQMTEAETRMAESESRGVGKAKMLTYRVPGTFYKEELEGATVEYTVQRNEEGMAKYQDQIVNAYAGFESVVTYNYGIGSKSGSYIRVYGVDLSVEKNIEKLYNNIEEMGESINIVRNN